MSRSKSTSRDVTEGISEELLNKICKQQSDIIFKKIDERWGKMEEKLESFMRQVEKNTHEIDTLENKIGKNEQYNRLNNLRVYGIKETSAEKQDDLIKIVLSLLQNKLNVQVKVEDLDRCHRIGVYQKGKNRPVLIRFISHLKKSSVYQNKKLLKKTGFVIREDLTAAKLQLVKEGIQKYGATNVWTLNGNVFVIKNNEKTIINNEKDL